MAEVKNVISRPTSPRETTFFRIAYSHLLSDNADRMRMKVSPFYIAMVTMVIPQAVDCTIQSVQMMNF